MKIKIYLLRFAVAGAAFIVGIGFFNVARFIEAKFSTAERKAVTPANIEETNCPMQLIEKADALVSEQTIVNSADSEKPSEYEFDASGDYYIIGDLPKGFENFDEIVITTRDYESASEENDYMGKPIPPEGFISAKKDYEFTRINIAGRQIAFQTETKKGISYKFVGKFTDNHDYNESEDYADLEGRLIKMRDSKKIAESKIKLVAGGC